MKRPAGILLVILALSSCSTLTKTPPNYDVMDLFNGVYTREGDPFTGRGYANSVSISGQSKNNDMKYVMQYEQTDVITLRSREVIKKICVMTKRVGNAYVRKTDVYIVLKKSDWVE